MPKITNSYTIHLGHNKGKKWIETVTLKVSHKDLKKFNDAKDTKNYDKVVQQILKSYLTEGRYNDYLKERI